MKKNYGMIERYLNVTSGDVTNQKMKDGAKGERKKLRGAIQTRDKKRG